MKVKITAMKAPWPKDSKVGDIVDVPGDSIPAWALGKCYAAEAPAPEPAPAKATAGGQRTAAASPAKGAAQWTV